MADNRSRVVCGVIYPFEDESHKFAYSLLCENKYKCIFIVHDRDYDEEGKLKKPHVHFLIRFQNARSLDSVANEMKIEVNYLQKCSSFNSYATYLIHLDEPLKTQYLPEEVCGNLFVDFLNALNKADTESIKVKKIIDFIYSKPLMKMSDLVMWVCENGFYDVFRRNYHMFKDVKLEKDGKFY